MKLTIQLQLLPDADQKQMLLDTMEQFNAAANYAARVGFEAKRFSQPTIHARCYHELRQRFGLSAQMAVRAIGKAVECFQRDKRKCPTFKPHGAMTYDQRLMSFKGIDKVSLLTLEGRTVVPMIFGEYQRERFDRIKGQCDLVYRRGKFYLYCSAEFPAKPPVKPKAFVGVDMGVANIATTSDGDRHCGKRVESVRQRHFRTRRSMGKKMSGKRSTRRNARKALKRIGNREQRFRRHTNHCISKQLVTDAKGSGRGIAVEDLNGIRDRTRFRRRQRARMAGWSFGQLRSFLEYKGKLYGVPVVAVDPRNTSRTCSECGHCEKANRHSQSKFRCKACGFTAHADHNGALNIARRGAAVNRLEESETLHEFALAA